MASPTVLPCFVWQLNVWPTLEEPNMSDHHFSARSPERSCRRIVPTRSPVDADEVEIFVPPNGPEPIVVEDLGGASVLIGAVAGTWPDEMVILALGAGRTVAAVVAFGAVGPQRICSDPQPLFALLEALDAVEVVVAFVGRPAMTADERQAQAAHLEAAVIGSLTVTYWGWLDLTAA